MGYCGPYKYQATFCEKLRSYLEANLAWMQDEMEKGRTRNTGTFQFSSFQIVIMVTLETTIRNRNDALWKYIKPQDSVLEWHALATGGQEWASIFKKFNSGTGMVAVADKSDVLYKTGYWASYNVPYFPEVFNASGLPALVEKFWDWFYYDKTPRALIFQRDHSERYGINGEANEQSMTTWISKSLQKKIISILKSSSCNPPQNGENAISARFDLNLVNGSYPFGAMSQRQQGGMNMKLTSYEMAKKYQMVAVNEPTWDQVPPFQWSTSPFRSLMHISLSITIAFDIMSVQKIIQAILKGHPDLWQFSPITISWN
ncbi:hypothetical protein XELAEV_18010385mg [Xenopus laevis]|uniref:Phospholipase B-like n=1 Tax=Xenopus laevis TaxID=8355 RepID=A0A974DV97_XENLA|nr:hypothetical protein XELAEV_18010385mg [Xenopus laevis]